MRTLPFCFFLLVWSLFSGCLNLERQYPEKRYFTLQATRNAEALETIPGSVLRVNSFRMSPAFETTELVYRQRENEYAGDFYNEFFLPPGDMVTEAVHQWLEDSGLFRHVVTAGSLVDAHLVLEGSVLALYADLIDPDRPKAVLSLQAFLLNQSPESETRIVFQNNYVQEIPMEEISATQYVVCANQALQLTLEALERDLGNQRPMLTQATTVGSR